MILQTLTVNTLTRADSLFQALSSASKWEDYKEVLRGFSEDDRAMLQSWLNDGKKLWEEGRSTRFGVAMLALTQLRVIGIESLDKTAQVALLWEALRLDEGKKQELPGPLDNIVRASVVSKAVSQIKGTGVVCALSAILLLTAPAKAQLIVSDPAVESLTLRKNLEDSLSWAESLRNDLAQQTNQITQITNQAQQITQMETQLRRLGDPSALTGILNGGGPRLPSMQPGFSKLKGGLSGASALADTATGLYRRVTSLSPGGNTVTRDMDSYRQYDMMRQIRQQHEDNSAAYAAHAKALQDETEATVAALDTATTDVEIRKYHAKLNALQAAQQALSAQMNKSALDSTIQRNDMEANRLMRQQAAAEAYDADAEAAMRANRNAKLPRPVYGAVHVD